MTGLTDADVLDAIAGLLTAPRSAAVLAHYPTLRIQTNNLHDALRVAIQSVDVLLDEWAAELSHDKHVTSSFELGEANSAYCIIAPALIRNVHCTASFLLEETRGLAPVDVDHVEETTPSFNDFVKLGAAVRAFLDALVQAAYQLTTFDGPQLNYKFLQSLLSFAAVAPESLHTNIVSREVQSALDAFVALPRKERKNSPFTKAAHEQFPQRLSVAAKAAGLPDWRRNNLDLLFSFCSDFVHSGYVSVLAVGEPAAAVAVGGPGDAFTPMAENFAEIKLRLLAECAGAYADLLLSIMRQAMAQMLISVPHSWSEELQNVARRVGDTWAILHRQLVEPVRSGLIGSAATLKIECMCGGELELKTPHDEWDRFCSLCGSSFLLHEVSDKADYVISALGPGDVLGGDAVKIPELAQTMREKLDRIVKKHAPQHEPDRVSLVLISDLDRCDEDTLQVPPLITSTPRDMAQGSLRAFVATKSLERCAVVRIRCNCGAEVDYRTAEQTNIVKCPQCRTVIGLVGVAGDGKAVGIRKPDGSPGWTPIQARDRFTIPGVATDS